MTISRNARHLGILIGLAATAAAAATSAAPALLAAFAAVSLIDLLLGAVGILVAAMTALAGLLLIFDARTDLAGARAWQDAAAGLTAAVSAVVEGSGKSYEESASDAWAEMVRGILTAHRFDRPQALPQPIVSDEPRQGPHRLDAVRSMLDSRSTASGIEASVCVDEPRIDLSRVIPDRALRLVASKVGGPTETAVSAKRLAKAKAATSRERRLVVNGGSSHFWSQPHAVVADEPVAIDERRDRGQEHRRDGAIDTTTTDQPACRGPPRDSGQVAFREKHRPPIDALGEIVVVDNLGDRVPIGAAELDVIEAYLDDVLRDVLGG